MPGRDRRACSAAPERVPRRPRRPVTPPRRTAASYRRARCASRRGKRAGAASGSSRTSVHASARPAAPPAADSTRLSVRSCRTSRARLLPSAARIVSSRWRAAPRESSRFATFAQAMSSTRATALARTRIAGRTVSVRSSTSGRARTTTAAPRPKKNSVDGGRRHAAGGGRTFGFRLFRRRAGPQPAQRGEDDRAVRLVGIGGDGGRNPEQHARVRKRQIGPRDPDDGPPLAVDLEGASDGGRIGGESIAPRLDCSGRRRAGRPRRPRPRRRNVRSPASRAAGGTPTERPSLRAGGKARSRVGERGSRRNRRRRHPRA